MKRAILALAISVALAGGSGVVTAASVSAATHTPFATEVCDYTPLEGGTVTRHGDRLFAQGAVMFGHLTGDFEGTSTVTGNALIDASSGAYISQWGTFVNETPTVTWTGIWRIAYSPSAANQVTGIGSDGSIILGTISGQFASCVTTTGVVISPH